MPHAPPVDIMTGLRAKTSSLLLVASIFLMTGSSLFALPRHEVCDAMRHACDKSNEAISCCCGDRSDSSPSRGPAGRTDVSPASHATTCASIPAIVPTATPACLRIGPPTLTRSADLRILFNDLRI